MRFFKITKNGFLIFKEIHKAEKEGGSYKIAGPEINALLSDLGPTFIKFGQMLSLRADLINPNLADELRKLLDHGSVVNENDINLLFKQELGKTPGEIFESFEVRPFAIASLSQVHLAKLEGKILAVKVQKPGIRAIIHKDLSLIKKMLMLLRILSFSQNNRELVRMLSVSVDEFFKWIEHELDYRLEILNITRIKNNFSGVSFFKAPDVLHALSGKLILTMEYIDGVSLNNLIDFVPDLETTEVIKYKEIHCNKTILIKEMLDIVFQQIFKDGYFHADPHPANILLTHKNCIAFIDFGVIGVFPSHLKEPLLKTLSGVIERDVKKVSQALLEINEVETNPPISEIEKGIRILLNDWQTGSVMEMSMAEAFYRLLLIAQKSKMEIPLSMFVLAKTILEYDGLLRKFDPEMDILNSLKSYVIDDKSIFNLENLQNIPVTIKGLLANPKDMPDTVLKFAQQLANEGVEFVSHLVNPSNAPK
jgi:ubiquinone biosynthesis protein